jgi:DNA-binding MarR family transcriptional regulator
VLRLVMIGKDENKPFDLTDLAEALVVSRQKAARLVDDLERVGLVSQERRRNRVVVLPTDTTIEHCRLHFPEVLATLIAKLRRIEMEVSWVSRPLDIEPLAAALVPLAMLATG